MNCSVLLVSSYRKEYIDPDKQFHVSRFNMSSMAEPEIWCISAGHHGQLSDAALVFLLLRTLSATLAPACLTAGWHMTIRTRMLDG
jgi:hypothetical protein